MARIIKSRSIGWEDMFRVGHMIECEYDCRVGDIIDECFVYCGTSPDNDTLTKGCVTYVIPLRFIAVAETHADLSQYGFYKAKTENRWIRIH